MSESAKNIDKIVQQLKSEVLDANWQMLEEHYKRGALIFIDHSLNLYEIGAHIAVDNAELIKEEMAKQNIIKIEDDNVKDFKDDTSEKKFQFIIIQPYVLIQYKEHTE